MNNKNRLELYYEIEEIMEEKYRAKTSIENFKNKLFQEEWNKIKDNIGDYLV